jgi:hypothetical protein
MQTYPVQRLKSPSSFLANSSVFRIIKLFKYELIKVIIFLFLFGTTLFVANTESEEYYKLQKTEIFSK